MTDASTVIDHTGRRANGPASDATTAKSPSAPPAIPSTTAASAVTGRTPPRSSARTTCVTCHQDQAGPARSSHPADETHGTCAGCHPPHPVEARLTKAHPCSRCHDTAKTDTALHAGAPCKSCHRPHGFDLKAKGPSLCASCHLGDVPLHPRRELARAVAPVKGHDRCADCHADANHTPRQSAADARTKCGTCHEGPQRRVSKNHAECLDCHLPHEGARHQDCLHCHDDKAKVGRHRPNRKDCDDCHSIHTSPPREAPPCISCHEPPLPLLHQNQGHATCTDCHQFHQQSFGGDRKSCLTGCHETLADHEPTAKRCVGCHPFEGHPQEVRR